MHHARNNRRWQRGILSQVADIFIAAGLQLFDGGATGLDCSFFSGSQLFGSWSLPLGKLFGLLLRLFIVPRPSCLLKLFFYLHPLCHCLILFELLNGFDCFCCVVRHGMK